MDLRKFRNVIVGAVAEERVKDSYWGWHVRDIDKKRVTISWGYLDYIGQKEPFCFEVFSEGDDITLIGGLHGKVDMHDDAVDDVFVWVGDKHWHDAPTMEKGIQVMVKRMARVAHAVY